MLAVFLENLNLKVFPDRWNNRFIVIGIHHTNRKRRSECRGHVIVPGKSTVKLQDTKL